MDDQRTDREGGVKRIRLRIGLRLMMLLVAMLAVIFAWVGVKREAYREGLWSEIQRLEIWRKSANQKIDDPQYGSLWRQDVKDTDAEIAKRRAELGEKNLNPTH
jgi:hypothetical protein